MNIRQLFSGIVLLQMLSACNLPASKVAPAHKIADKEKVKHLIVHPKNDTLTIVAVGDLMLGTSYPNNSTLPPDSAKHTFDAALPYLQKAAITMGNLEGTLLDSGIPANYKLHQISKSYLFRMPGYYGGILKKAGFNMLSLANNHIGDFDQKGRKSTMHILDSVGIAHGGQLSHPSSVVTVKGIRYGFCAFAPNSQTLPILDLPNAKNIVKELKSRCDIVIVSFHGGGEGPMFEHVAPGMESYIGEKRGNLRAFTHAAIDAGADMVLGNGPHVTRAVELYNNRLIAYSLGNFCTYKCVNVEGISGLAPLLRINVNKHGEFLNGSIIAFKQNHALGLVRDTDNRVVKRIKSLTESDFPDTNLLIAADGLITPLPQKILAAVEQ